MSRCLLLEKQGFGRCVKECYFCLPVIINTELSCIFHQLDVANFICIQDLVLMASWIPFLLNLFRNYRNGSIANFMSIAGKRVNVWLVIIRVWLANATTACHATFVTTWPCSRLHYLSQIYLQMILFNLQFASGVQMIDCLNAHFLCKVRPIVRTYAQKAFQEMDNLE